MWVRGNILKYEKKKSLLEVLAEMSSGKQIQKQERFAFVLAFHRFQSPIWWKKWLKAGREANLKLKLDCVKLSATLSLLSLHINRLILQTKDALSNVHTVILSLSLLKPSASF